MNLVFLYGPPAAGKFTVGAELAALTGYKFWHNHVSIDAIKPVFGFGDPSFGTLVSALRKLMIAEAATQSVDLIMTYAYAHPDDAPEVAQFIDSYESLGGHVCLVQLTCEVEELDRRMEGESRKAMGKLLTVERAQDYRVQYDLTSPISDRPSLKIDTTYMPPNDAARTIVGHYRMPVVQQT